MALTGYNHLPALVLNLKGASLEGLLAAAHAILDAATDTCPVDTGALRDSGAVEPVDAESVKVAYGADYAYWVHEGHHTRSGSFVPARPWLVQAATATDVGAAAAPAIARALVP